MSDSRLEQILEALKDGKADAAILVRGFLRDDFIDSLAKGLPHSVLCEFRELEKLTLKRHLERVGLMKYPPLVGPSDGERACGDCLCEVCGQPFNVHPTDWRLDAIGYGNRPFLAVLCDGRRVKL